MNARAIKKIEQPTQEDLKDAVMITSLFLFHLKIAPKKSVAVNLKNPALCGPIDTHTWASWLKPGAKPNHAILSRFTRHLANNYAAIKCWSMLSNDMVENDSDIDDGSLIVVIAQMLQQQPWRCMHEWFSGNNESTYKLLKHLNNEKVLDSLECEKEKLDAAIKDGFCALHQVLYKLSNVHQKSESLKEQKIIILDFIRQEYQREVASSQRSSSTDTLGNKRPITKSAIIIMAVFAVMIFGYYLYQLSSSHMGEKKRTLEPHGESFSAKSEPEIFSSNVDTLRQQRIINEVKRVRSLSPQIISEPVHKRIMVDAVPKPTIAGVELVDYWVIWDLRSLKKLSSLDRTRMLSPAVQRIRQRVIKTAELGAYRLPAYTSGIDIYSRSHSLPLKVYASDERNKIAEYSVKPRMLEFDVSGVSIGDEFTLDVTKTYWNAFQGEDQSWVGVTTELPTLSINFLVIFPDDRPYRELDYFASNKDKNRIDVEDSKHIIKDKDKTWVSWHIVNPKAHHGYHIDWEW